MAIWMFWLVLFWGEHPTPKPVKYDGVAKIAHEIEAPRAHRVVIGGHLYGLYVKAMEGGEPLIYRENVMAAYAREIQRLEPDAAFQLGDITRFGTPPEWAMMQRAWADVSVPNFWVAGNHDLRNTTAFEANGGLRNKAVVVGKNKYLCLDAKTVFEADDLAFIRDHLSDYQRYDHVLVLMHFRLMNDRDPKPEDGTLDPYKTYTGVSNWNRDVVPLLLGKVRYVITGDHYARGAMRSLRSYAANDRHDAGELFYVHTAFKYRHQSPLVFIELVFGTDGGLRIEPRVVPLDLHDGWYEDRSIDPVMIRKYLEQQRKNKP